MRHVIFLVAALAAGGLDVSFTATAHAQSEPTGACAVTAENARDRLAQTGGDPVWALREWRAICPGDGLAQRYAEALAKEGGAPIATPNSGATPGSETANVQQPAPPKAEEKPTGTWVLSGRKEFDDGSGFEDWEDRVTFLADGTAELRSKTKEVLYSQWYLSGCDNDTQSGTVLVNQRFRVTISGSAVTFTGDGPVDVQRKEPGCWDLDTDTYFAETWSLRWRDGRLTSTSGDAYTRMPE